MSFPPAGKNLLFILYAYNLLYLTKYESFLCYNFCLKIYPSRVFLNSFADNVTLCLLFTETSRVTEIPLCMLVASTHPVCSHNTKVPGALKFWHCPTVTRELLFFDLWFQSYTFPLFEERQLVSIKRKIKTFNRRISQQETELKWAKP